MSEVVTELTIDARGVTLGLSESARASEVAQQALDRYLDRLKAAREASDQQGATLMRQSTSIQRAARDWENLKRSIDDNYRSTSMLEADLLKLDRAVTRLGLSQAEAATWTDKIIARHDMAAAAARRHAAAEKILAFGAASRRRGVNDNFAGANIGYQLQDVAVQSAMGGINPAMIGLMQGTQMAMSFQGQSAAEAARSLGGAITGLLNPVMLLSVGLTTAAAVAIQYFTSTGTEIDRSSDALSRHSDLISRLKDHYGEAAAGLKAYAGESSAILQADLARAREQYQGKVMAGARAALAEINSYSASSLGPQTPLFGQMRISVKELTASIEAGRPALGTFIETLAKLEVSPYVTSTQKEVIRSIRDMQEAASGVQAERALGGLGTLFDRNTEAMRRG